jgi:tetratricopeptide (TPR) repeat protein
MAFRSSNLIAIALMFLALSLPTAGLGAEDDGTADLKARTHFVSGEYKQALEIYARLYAETLHPTYLRNIARCHQNLGDADKAIANFRDYLRKAKDLTAEQRAEVEGFIAEMEQLKRSNARRADTPPPLPEPREPPAALVGPPAVVEARPSDPDASPFYTRAWFWVVTAIVVAGAATAVLVLSGDRDPPHGDLGVVDLRNSR